MTIIRRLFRTVFPEQPVDLLEQDKLIAIDYESLC
jgi:hypothetical protein